MRKFNKSKIKQVFIILIVINIFVLLLYSDIYSFGKNKVNRETFEWNIMKTLHFNIFYPLEMEEFVVFATKIAEEGYVHIANYLNHELTEVVPIIIYPSHIDFQENNILLSIIGEGTGGFTESFKNRIVIPFTGSYHELRHVLTHELVHAFQYNIMSRDITGKNTSSFNLSMSGVPLWIIEGMSEYLSIGFDETADMTMRDILFNEKYATLMDLTALNIRSIQLLYKEGQAFFFFIEETYGRDRIGELLRDIRDIGGYSNFDEIMRINTGKKLEDLSLEWIRFFKKRYFPIVKGKNFVEEEGKQITFHQKTNTTFNICPAVSPDGKNIAYLTNRDIYSSISVIDVKKKKNKKREIKTLIQGNTSSRFEGMHLLSNYLTWSRDAKYISFVSQSYGSDSIFIIDSINGMIKEKINLPFRAVMDPSLSPDGKMVIFIGQRNNSSDIYIYDIEQKRLSRLTDNPFSERYPKLSSDNRFVIFSSNWNQGKDYERDNYNIFRMNLSSGVRTQLIDTLGNDLQADLSNDDEKILYISNRTGIYNAYIHDLQSGEDYMITDVLCGIFYPRWFPDGKSIAFVAYQNLGYDIFVKDIDNLKELKRETNRDTQYKAVEYPAPYFDPSDAVFDKYSTKISTDWLSLALAGTPGYLFSAFQLGLSDYLGDNRIIFTGDYFRYEDQNDFNFNIVYYYLKYRWDFGIGLFRQKNPIGIFSLTSINDLIHHVYLDTISMNHFGIYSIAKYPFSRFFRFNIETSSSRYEIDYSEESDRQDIYTNLNQLSLSLNYDNILWGYLAPLDGFRGEVSVEQTFHLTEEGSEFTSFDVDLRRYFLLSKRYVIALRGSGGKIIGKDSDLFKYYLGGFDTLRGHPFFEYTGNNVFLVNMEFRFIFIEGIKFGWPLFFRIGGIGGVLFADFGSAWDDNYRFKNPDTDEFDDFKADMGFGFRFTLYPVLIFKLDFAWPYNNKSFEDRDVIFSIGFEY